MQAVYVKNVSEFLDRHEVPVSPAVKGNGFIVVSGAPPLDPDTGELVKGDVAAQTEAIMRYLERTLDAAGSSMSKVVKVTIYAANAAHFRAVNAVYTRHFRAPYPARAFLTVGSWPMEIDIEIECTALA